LARSEAALRRDSAAVPTPARAQALYGAAQMAREMGDYPLARQHFWLARRTALMLVVDHDGGAKKVGASTARRG